MEIMKSLCTPVTVAESSKDLKGFRSCQAWIDYASPIAKITPLPEPRAKREKQTKVRITK
jgi:hypothetical protein